jgi:hypothetical protein
VSCQAAIAAPHGAKPQASLFHELPFTPPSGQAQGTVSPALPWLPLCMLTLSVCSAARPQGEGAPQQGLQASHPLNEPSWLHRQALTAALTLALHPCRLSFSNPTLAPLDSNIERKQSESLHSIRCGSATLDDVYHTIQNHPQLWRQRFFFFLSFLFFFFGAKFNFAHTNLESPRAASDFARWRRRCLT